MKKEDRKKRGISDSWVDVRKREGRAFRFVLCATGGMGDGSKNHDGSKNQNAYVINGRPLKWPMSHCQF